MIAGSLIVAEEGRQNDKKISSDKKIFLMLFIKYAAI
jgi:hypothetical protein